MRRLLMTVLALAIAGTALRSADTPKDSPVVAKTRKKLETKVTVDYNNTPLKEVVADLKQQVENLSFKIDTSMNQIITYQATDKPLKEVLDQMFKKNGLGYVISKKKDRYEGWIILKQGKERGDEEVKEESKTAGKTAAKSKDKAGVKDKPAAKDKLEEEGDKAEQEAARKLNFAKELADAGKTAKAKERYEEIISKYPKTKAALEAKELLKNLKK